MPLAVPQVAADGKRRMPPATRAVAGLRYTARIIMEKQTSLLVVQVWLDQLPRMALWCTVVAGPCADQLCQKLQRGDRRLHATMARALLSGLVKQLWSHC